MKSLNWTDGLPDWLRDDEAPACKSYGRCKYAEATTTDDEIITLVIGWTELPATWLEPRQIENEHWTVYVSHEEIDSGEGDERDVISALDRILENLHITLEE